MDDDVWRWVWLLAAVGFMIGEIAVAGTFFLLPFGIGALAAAVTGFAGGSVPLQWVLFLGVSTASIAALYPLRKRFDRSENQDGIGARRLIGQAGVVLQGVPAGPDESGLVRVGREEWRAQSTDGSSIAPGTTVKIVEVRGTRVVVHPVSAPSLGAPTPEESA
jgi:membrane protein implicated in regulation of membrane protease activity